MQNTALSLNDLRSGTAPHQEGFPPLEDALVRTVIDYANAKMRDAYHRSKAIAAAVDVQAPEEPAEHYFVEIPLGSVSQRVIDRVIEAYRVSGWHHTQMSGSNLVIARTKYVPTKTHGSPVTHAPVDQTWLAPTAHAHS